MVDTVIGWINDPSVQQIGAIGGLLALVWAVLLSCYRWGQRSLDKKISCRRIVQTKDRDLDRVINFHLASFKDTRLAGFDPNFKKWIGEYEEQVAHGETIEWDEYLIIAKTFLSGMIVGYLHASLHTEMRYVFISYFDTDSKFGLGLSPVGKELLRCLAAHIKETGVEFRGLIAELDLEGGKASRLSNHFGRIAKDLGYCAYIIDGIDYHQPVIELDEVRKQRRLGTNVPTAGAQLLLYVPFSARDTNHIPRKEAEDILRFVVMEVYPDGYDTDENAWKEYMAYAKKLYEDLSVHLNEHVHIKPIGQ